MHLPTHGPKMPLLKELPGRAWPLSMTEVKHVAEKGGLTMEGL